MRGPTWPSPRTEVSVLLGNGDGTFQPEVRFGAHTDPSSLAVADLNADGRPDLAVPNYGSDDVSVLLNTTSDDTTPPVITIAPGPQDTVASTGWFNKASSGTDGVEVERDGQRSVRRDSPDLHRRPGDDAGRRSGKRLVHDSRRNAQHLLHRRGRSGQRRRRRGSTAMPAVFKVDETSSVDHDRDERAGHRRLRPVGSTRLRAGRTASRSACRPPIHPASFA